MNMYKPFKALLLITGLAFFANTTYASEDEIYKSFFSNAGAGGYDVVAYFTVGEPVEGDDDIGVEYKGADWYFASQENLATFNQDPEKYLPQYGGYCSWAVANGDLASGDPLQWKVLNEKLYLNYDADIQAKWTADRDNLIVLGDKNWPGVLN